MKLLHNKVAVITGSSKGIGKAIALTFAKHGAHVVVTGTNKENIKNVTAQINSTDAPRAIGKVLDVTNSEQVKNTIDETITEFDKIDILVNNAGIYKSHLIINFPLKDWQEIFRVNMEGTFLCSQAAAKAMINQKNSGCIINISSCGAKKADLEDSAYSASKAAVICFTRTLALELGHYNIRANCILPGPTLTDMLQDLFIKVPGKKRDIISKTALGYLPNLEDQANAALFLASDMAKCITGEYLIVSGGYFMNT